MASLIIHLGAFVALFGPYWSLVISKQCCLAETP